MRKQDRIANALIDAGALFDVRLTAGLNRVDLFKGFANEDGTLTHPATPLFHPRSELPDTTIVLTAQEVLDHALSMAAMRGSREAAQFLLTHGAAINAQPPGFYWKRGRGCSAMHKAANEGEIEMVDFLLESGADPTIRDLQGDNTPAGWARYSNEPEIADILEVAERRAAGNNIDGSE